jgi:hypothetical protein
VVLNGQEARLNALLNYFVNLCLLRAAPQELPASEALLGIVFAVNLAVSTLLMLGSELTAGLALLESLVELGLMLAVLRTALSLVGHPGRFQQAATAIMGSSALMALLALPLIGSGGAGPAGLLLLALVIWSVIVLGHIVRHTFDLALGQGVVISLLYTIGSYTLISSLFLR